MDIPRVVIGAATSDAGKTAVSTGLMAALTARGYVVQPFKVGPDFIDPTHHTRCCNRTCRSLDPFMMGEDGVYGAFVHASSGADIAVIEGVMGLHDGIDGTAFGSTAHVARILDAPVLLVVDAKGASRTVHAIVRGIAGYDPTVPVAGTIFNRIGSERHRTLIERGCELPSMGWIPRDDALSIPSRHLGLSLADELSSHAAFGEIVESHVDLEGVLGIARSAPPLEGRAMVSPVEEKTAIGVAFDSAFCFYYADNFDRLRAAGARLVFFSPSSESLPLVDALYIGGGYPELHAAELEVGPARGAIARAATDGMPVLGECGGLAYLARSLESGGRMYRMCDVLPAGVAMTGGIRGLGYVEGTWVAGPARSLRGAGLRGHEFHYSECRPEADARYAVALSRGRGIVDGRDGLFEHATVGGYTHAYFSNRFCSAFVAGAEAYARR